MFGLGFRIESQYTELDKYDLLTMNGPRFSYEILSSIWKTPMIGGNS